MFCISMRLIGISITDNLKSKISCHNNNNQNNFPNTRSIFHSTTQPKCDVFIKNEPSFEGKMPKIPSLVQPSIEDILNRTPASQIFRNNILRIAKHGVPCPCCGRIMLDIDSFNNFKKAIEPLHNPRDILQQIGQYSQYLHPVEKNIFKMLVKENQQKPKMSLHEIILSKLHTAERDLITEQAKIFVNIGLLSRELAPEDCEKVNKLLKKTYAQIFDKEPTSKFSRKIFISELEGLLNNTDKRLRKIIVESAIQLPTAYNNKDAFIVKYAKKNYKKQTPDKAIAIRLLSNSTVTIEHINPHKLKGSNSPKNLAIECACDNNKRRHDSLAEQIKNNPQMPQNYQRYMKRLSELVEEGKLEKSYVLQTNATFGELSEGVLYRDLSKLRYNPKKHKAALQKEQIQTPSKKKQKTWRKRTQNTTHPQTQRHVRRNKNRNRF